MRKLLLIFALWLAAGSAMAVGDQAYLGIFAETRSMKVAGKGAMPEMPKDMDPQMLAKIPGMAQAMAMFAPQRLLSVRLWSPGIAPQDAFAYLVPPAGLKQGNKMDLGLYRPKAGKGESGGLNPSDIPEFTIKCYWGSSATVKPGQPEIITWGKLTPEQKNALRESARKASRKDSYFYKPDWTTGYWPTGKQPGAIGKEASLVGNYALKTNYIGEVAIDVPSNVDFLAPIELSSPDLKKSPSLDAAIPFKWKAIPNLLGSHACIIGMEGENTLIIWTSSEVKEEMGLGWDYLQMAEVAELVKQTVMMKGDRVDATVPAGIFKNCDTALFNMVGYGPGVALDKTQPLPRVQTKTTLNVMLGGKAVKGMGEMDAEDSGE